MGLCGRSLWCLSGKWVIREYLELLLVKSPIESLLTGLKFKNPEAPAMKLEAEEGWGR